MRVDEAAKEIILKVVYYGPGMAGKTTNLTIIHDRVPSNAAGDLQVVDTHSERTLRFDLLGVDVGQMLGHNLRFDFFTVPGQSYYAATRRAVLAGTDGVVFVADSRREALDENIEAMNEMLNSLRHHGLPEDLPVVLQYNKQDLPTALKPEQLEPLLNIRGWPSRSSVARDGTGVMETMQDITRLTRDWAMTSDSLPVNPTVPVLVKPEPAATWLISCYRCQAMLEVPDAKVGSLYACGVCSSQLEVYESERGLTRAPVAAPKPATARVNRDDSDYGLQTISDQKGSALGSAGAASGQRPGAAGHAGGMPFEVPAYDLIDLLDENPLARRSRVRERATGRILRALSVNPVLLRQPGYFDAFEPHVRLASQVKHPYILPLAAMHANKDIAVLFSQEATDYEHLGHVLARRRALAPPHAMGILRQIALALEEAARHGVVHGWLRPEVVLVNPEGAVFVDEIAFPKNHRFLVRELSGASAATEYYLAPEHINGESRSDVRSDIFMLGALLFRMFTGEGLVTGYNAHEALHKIVANGARSLRSVQTGISRDLETFYQRLVTTERKDRYQTYRELIDALDQFGGGAKRQTMRLTQSQNLNAGNAGPMPGTGTQRRQSGTAQLGRPGTTEFPRGLGSTSTSAYRAQIRPPDYTTTMMRKRKPDRSGAMVGWILLIGVLIAGGLAALIFYPQHSDVLPEEKNPSSGTNPETPAHHDGEPTNPVVVPAGTTASPPNQSGSTTIPPRAPLAANTSVSTSIPPGREASSPVDGAPVVPAGDERDRIGVVLQIGILERQHLFKQAMDMCDHMPTADERQAKILHVVAMHDAAKRDIESQVANDNNINEIAALLLPVRESWQLGDDAEWAAALLAFSIRRLGSQPSAPVAQSTPTPQQPAAVSLAGAVTPTPVVLPVAPANTPERSAAICLQILDALAVVNYPMAQQLTTTLVPGSPEESAIKRLLDVWNKRGDIIGRVVIARSPKLRVTHPATSGEWDITQAGPTGLTVSTPEGTSSSLSWNQVQLRDLARVCEEMSSSPAAKPEEHDLAVVMHLIAKDATMARSQLRKAKSSFDAQALVDYDVLITQQIRRDAMDLLARANAAAASGNARVLAGLIEQLRHVDRSAESLVAGDLARLSGQDVQQHAAPGTEESPSRDHLLFRSQDDINAFSEHGGWQLANGGISNVADGARLMRHDLRDARTANLIFQQSAQRGSMLVEFRGVRVIIDFSSNSYVVRFHDGEFKPRPLTILAKAANSLYFEVKQPNNQVNIEINNGVDSVSVKAGELTDTFTISASSGAQISVQELQITRSAQLGKADKPDSKADKQQEIHDLGLEPLGGAYLDNPLIVLPATTGGANEASGIAVLVRDNILGASFECKGTGILRVQLGNPADRTIGDWVDVPVHAVAGAYKVTWTASVMTVTDAAGTTLGSKAISGVHGYFILSALHEATLMKTPVMIHQ